MLLGTVFGSLFPPIFGSLRATFFAFFCPKATGELGAIHFYVELLPKRGSDTVPSPEILQKWSPKGLPKVPKRCPGDPRSLKNTSTKLLLGVGLVG